MLYSIGDRIPRAEWRRRRLWKISRYSKVAFASSIRGFRCCRFSSSVCILPRKDSMAALSWQSPIDPLDGTGPDFRARSVKAHEPELDLVVGMSDRPCSR